MDERVPGAVVVPGFDEEVLRRHDEDESYANDSRHSEDGRNEINENSNHAITARVVDPEEEHRVLREQLQQVLREEREHANVAVVHTATIDRGMEHGNKAVVHTAANDSDGGDVERGNITARQAQQAPTINADPPKFGGFWHGTRGRLAIAAFILVIVATAVGVTLALVLGKETPQSDPQSTATTTQPAPESTPTPAPSPEQTSENTSPLTAPPTPEQTLDSTSTPTPPASPIENGNCSYAWPLLVDGAVTVGSNENATRVNACATNFFGRGAWYQFNGTGRRVTMSTCNEKTTDFTTILSVLSSKDGACGGDCQATASGYDIAEFSGCNIPDTGSTVSIDTILNLVYYVSVIGSEDKVGEFGLTIFDDSVGCEDDKEAQPVDGVVYVGSNVNGAYASSCTGEYGRGAWYRFIGTGRRITVSTCNEKTTTDVATVLSVLSSKDGTCGDDKLVCNKTASGYDIAEFSGCNTPDTGSTVSIDTILNWSYYASVIGYEGAVGEFGLTIFDDSVGCEDDKEAQPVDEMETVGSNVNGTYVSACATGDYGRGAWYRFIGNGRRMTVSTCNEKTTTACTTILSVLSSKDGTCGDDKLVCNKTAAGYDIAEFSGCSTPSTGSTVSIDTILNSIYYASVIGYEGAVGEFGLMIFDDSPASRRVLPEVLAPAFVNEVIADQTDGSFTINKRMDHLHSIKN
jgi:cell division septation protein DedD